MPAEKQQHFWPLTSAFWTQHTKFGYKTVLKSKFHMMYLWSCALCS